MQIIVHGLVPHGVSQEYNWLLSLLYTFFNLLSEGGEENLF
jgi:hypothetical protein